MSPAMPPVAEPPTFAIPTMMKYKIPKETEFNHSYEMPQKSEMWHLQPKPQDRNVCSKTQGRNHHDSQVPKLWKETSRLEHIMPREERANESCNGKNSTTKDNRSTSEHIRVWVNSDRKQSTLTHSAPTVMGILPCTSPIRLQDKIEDTRTKSVHAGNHDKSVDSTTAAQELYSIKSTEHSSIGGEHHIAWDTATPSCDYPTEYTPACQSTRSIHRRTNKTDDHHYAKTLMSKDKQFRLPGYQQYSVPKGPNSHGSMILVGATIPSSEVEPVHCGDGSGMINSVLCNKIDYQGSGSDIKNGLLRALNLNIDVFHKKT
ncbi:hypothetical protein Hamer_G006196 [Homarus americanus]|uniref:Uncharacterized protein n=1 Tax=Homarus americanus TaxID=6706 RepID=A0A8J5JLA4_HOMAM|nr:hypothetical protein Hamer_G006196 [Homarus americanus]